MAAFGGKPALQLSVFRFANLNVCFHQKRSFSSWKISDFDRQLTARSSRRAKTGAVANVIA